MFDCIWHSFWYGFWWNWSFILIWNEMVYVFCFYITFVFIFKYRTGSICNSVWYCFMFAHARVLGTILRRAAEGERSALPRRFFVRDALPPAIFHDKRFSLWLLNVCTRQSLWYNNAQSGRRRAISAASAIFRAECVACGDFSCGMFFFVTFECLHMPESWVQ